MECLCNGAQQFCCFFVTGPILLDPAAQCGAFDKLGHHVDRTIIRSSHVMHGNDVGMIQAGHDASLGKIRFGVLGLLDEEDLVDRLLEEACVVLPQEGPDLVRGDAGRLGR